MEGCIWHVTVPSSMRFCVDESASWETGEDALITVCDFNRMLIAKIPLQNHSSECVWVQV